MECCSRPHPGETIQEDYVVPLGMSVSALAKALGIGAARMNEIVPRRAGSHRPHRNAPGSLL
jgi:addiction module HigA family antidote